MAKKIFKFESIMPEYLKDWNADDPQDLENPIRGGYKQEFGNPILIDAFLVYFEGSVVGLVHEYLHLDHFICFFCRRIEEDNVEDIVSYDDIDFESETKRIVFNHDEYSSAAIEQICEFKQEYAKKLIFMHDSDAKSRERGVSCIHAAQSLRKARY